MTEKSTATERIIRAFAAGGIDNIQIVALVVSGASLALAAPDFWKQVLQELPMLFGDVQETEQLSAFIQEEYVRD